MVKRSFLKNIVIVPLVFSLCGALSSPANAHAAESIKSSEYIQILEDQQIISYHQAREAERYILEHSLTLTSSSLDTSRYVSPQALPALPVVLACVGTVGLSAYQAYKGGDPVEYIANAIIGCMPFGFAAKPAVMSIIRQFKPEIVRALKVLGATALAFALDRTPAH